MLRQAADELQYLVRRLRSPVVEQHGFVEALREHLAMFERRSSISAPLELQGTSVSLPPDVEQAAFRIVQEALTNAEKHSRASEARVLLRFDPGLLECVVCDDGVGFDPSAVSGEPAVEGGGQRRPRAPIQGPAHDCTGQHVRGGHHDSCSSLPSALGPGSGTCSFTPEGRCAAAAE